MTTLHETWYNDVSNEQTLAFASMHWGVCLDACERAREHEHQKGVRAFAGAEFVGHCFLRKRRKMSHYTEKFTFFITGNAGFSVEKRKLSITPPIYEEMMV